ncbi:MAG: 2,3-bisphosphoglycerate-independent phosphoglycerate mutase [Cyanobacteria bacterium J06639_1]
MSVSPVSPVVLVILDGWGYRTESDGNAILNANTPVVDSLWAAYPHALVATSGKAVGLPSEQMGNSEVGHLNLGAGRVVPQELVRISDAAEDGTLASHAVLKETCARLQQNGGKLHLVGLCSDGGVHSHLDHIEALIDIAVDWDLHPYLHVITDGRDTSPQRGVEYATRLEQKVTGKGTLATLGGRYYAMDRDRRWDRTEQMYSVMTDGSEGNGLSATEVLKTSYAEGVTDEFIPPVRLAPGAIESGDALLVFNFRPDRARQLVQAFAMSEFDGFEREFIEPLTVLTMTQYASNLPVKVLFAPQNLDNILGQVVSDRGLKQFRIAETEKYAHVTYFFNGGLEKELPGETRELVPSPPVATYDRAPAMSAKEVTDKAIAAIVKKEYSLVVINYANPDMVGHTGNYDATLEAIATVDTCLGELVSAIGLAGGTALITADHGNAEYMWDERGNPWTAHTTNPVPLLLIEGEGRKIPGRGNAVELREDGRLADIAPTILEILGIEQPEEMTGRSLFVPMDYEVRANRSPVRLSL